MQVRIVHEGMRFPLWLHGHTVITFHVASVFPKKAVGKMMPISVYIALWYIVSCHILGQNVEDNYSLYFLLPFSCVT